MRHTVLLTVILTSLSLNASQVTGSKVSGLVNQVINVSLPVPGELPPGTVSLHCQPSVPYIKFITQDRAEQDEFSGMCNTLFLEKENISLQIRSNLIGIFSLYFYSDDKTDPADHEIEVVVGRIKVKENILVNVGLGGGIGLALLIMGMDIELEQVVEVIKRPVGPLVGFCSQFLVMPLVSYGLGWLLLQTNYERLGLLLLGCCPGGVGSNFWTAMLGGDINLSVTMTFFSSVAAFAMTSFWIWILGSPLVSEEIPIPFGQLAIALVSFAVPVVLGVLARKWRPELCEKIKRRLGRPLWLLIVLALVIGGVVMNLFFFYLVTWRHLLSGALLGLCGYTLGGVAAILAGMNKSQVIAVAIETAIQNGGIAVVVLNLTFPSPYSDMALLPILAFFFCSAGPFLFLIYLVRTTIANIRNRISSVKEEKDDIDRSSFKMVKTDQDRDQNESSKIFE